jgi:hypothetical protein
MSDPYLLLAGVPGGLGSGRGFLDSIMTGAGFALGAGIVSGIGNAGDVQNWPDDRKEGLTFGELQELESFMRNRLLPPLAFTDSRSVYPASSYYREATPSTRTLNELGETPGQAAEVLVARWQSLSLSTRSELVPAMRFVLGTRQWNMLQGYVHLTDDGTLTWRTRHRPWQWPGGGSFAGFARRVRDELGTEAWYRIWAALAIGRDLFAERFEQVGGVRHGLQDDVTQLQETGTAVTGRWENLAGRWAWKGWDIEGRPLLTSNALLPPPAFPPSRAREVRERNGHVWRWLFGLIRRQDPRGAAQVAEQLVPAMTANFNRLARVHRDASEISPPPATVEALGELFTSYWNLLGLDLLQELADYGGEDFANVVRDQAVPRDGELFEDPVPLPVAGSTGETDLAGLA